MDDLLVKVHEEELLVIENGFVLVEKTHLNLYFAVLLVEHLLEDLDFLPKERELVLVVASLLLYVGRVDLVLFAEDLEYCQELPDWVGDILEH